MTNDDSWADRNTSGTAIQCLSDPIKRIYYCEEEEDRTYAAMYARHGSPLFCLLAPLIVCMLKSQQCMEVISQCSYAETYSPICKTNNSADTSPKPFCKTIIIIRIDAFGINYSVIFAGRLVVH